jgi:hypothetical protein
MGVVYACSLSFMSKYIYQSCGPNPMTRVDINDNNQSSNNYKITEEDLEEINKEYLAYLLILVDPLELSDPELIKILVITREGHDTRGTSRRKKTKDVQKLSSALEETALHSPGGGGDDEVDKEEKNGQEYQ